MTKPSRSTVGGRALSVFVSRLISEIGSGHYVRGGYLPTVRELADLYDTSPETARRGLKRLEEQGLLKGEGRSGFRIAQPTDDRKSRPIAFVTTHSPDLPAVQPTTAALFLAFQAAGAQRGWPFLGTHAGAGGVDAITEQLRASNAWGVILDSINEELYEAVVRSGLPTVMVNSWIENSPVSTVLQDNYRGGYLAAEYLFQQGARHIGWVGHINAFCHARERFAGVAACVRAEGIDIERRDCLEPRGKLKSADVAALFDRSDRPDGILAFGIDSTAIVKQVADERGLVIGRDFRLVSWVPEECYEQHHRGLFRGETPCPAVVWSAVSMTNRAFSLLSEVRDGTVKESMRLLIPTRLKVDEQDAQ